MAQNSITSDISAFWDRLRGQDRMKSTDNGLTILNAPSTPQEKITKQKIQTLTQYIRNKNWNRRHIEYFDEYRRMVATFPIIKAGIDIYAEETCNTGPDGNIIAIKTENKKVKELLEQCYFKNLNINTRGYLVAREICKFGNVYAYLVTRPRDGVVDMYFLPPETIMREQMYDPTNIENYRFSWYGAGGGAQFEPWELVHWKNTEDIEMEPYGVSILRPIVDTWRRVVLIREALVIYRITRAPSKLLFKIGTDGLTGEEAYRFAQDMKKEIQKKPLVNPQTGEVDFKYNPISIEENIFMPVYEGSPSDVQVLEGAANLDQVEDYKIIKDDLFAGLKIPKSWLSFEEDLSNKAALGEEDIRFAKTIQRQQHQFIEGLVHIGVVHLFLNGCSEEEMQSFKIEMNNPSIASEKKRLELIQARLEIAKSAWDYNNTGLNLMSYTDVLRNILKFTEEEIRQTIKSQFVENKLRWRLAQLVENGTYEEPDKDKLQGQIKAMAGGEDEPMTGFDTLKFENIGIKDIVKNKLDEELNFMFPKASAGPTRAQLKIVRGSLMENLERDRQQLNG